MVYQSFTYSPSLLFYPTRSPQSLPPSYFILIAIHKLLIGTWCIPSTTLPVTVQTSFVFLCAYFVETYAAAPATMSLDKKDFL